MSEEQQEHIEEEAIEHLKNIEEDLEEIKNQNRIPNRRLSFVHGIWYGAGALVGGVLGLALLGWILSLFGVIPGFADIAHYLQGIVNQFHR
jgi:hypothetical protein